MKNIKNIQNQRYNDFLKVTWLCLLVALYIPLVCVAKMHSFNSFLCIFHLHVIRNSTENLSKLRYVVIQIYYKNHSQAVTQK